MVCLKLLRHTIWGSRVWPATTTLPAKVTNRAFAATAKMFTEPELLGNEADDVLFSSQNGIRLMELNRPKKLNSLNGSMARKILPRLKEWKECQSSNMVMVSGAGPKALCAGGDVAALAQQNEQGPEGQQISADFFRLEYIIDHTIATYSKPFISIMDGVTMGGGVGLSVHAPFRIATERTIFAMPETTIGFFPDVGGSFFLPRLDGEIGTYLALTSERLKGVEALYAGISTHYLQSSVLDNMKNRLGELVFNNYDPLPKRLDLVNKTMAEFSTDLPTLQQGPMPLAGSLRNAIDRCFKFSTMEEIFQALEKETEQKEWAQKTLETLSVRSPTSLKVTLRQMRQGRKWSISDTFKREAHISAKFMRHPDFVEGVNARLLSKPPRQASWKPATLQEVTDDYVTSFFEIPENESQLPLWSDTDYKSYPHGNYGLPLEADIEKFVRAKFQERNAIISEFVNRWGEKKGVKEKVEEVLARRTITENGLLRWIE